MILNIAGARHKVVGALSVSGQHAIAGFGSWTFKHFASVSATGSS